MKRTESRELADNRSPNTGRRLVRPGAGFREFPREEIEQSLPARFEARVSEAPGRTAVRAGDRSWSYGEIDAAANRIANAILRERGPTKDEEPVALLLSQGAPLVAAILGTLKAGKLYVPLDGSHPRARLEQTLAESGAALLLADGAHRALASELSGDGRDLLAVEDALASAADTRPRLAVAPENGAYIFYTSGSTGRPKGVVDTHRNVLHNIRRYTNTLAIGPEDRLSLVQSCSFSGTVSSLFGALGNGATLCLFDLRSEGTARLAEWIAAERVTIFHSVPSIFRSFAASGRRYPDLRLLRLEGDTATRQDVELFRRHLGRGCVLVNGLGTTETGLCRQFFLGRETPLGGDLVPVGYPVEDMRVVLLGAEGQPSGDGDVGEIAVESRYLARGYWKRPDLDRTAFSEAPTGDGARLYRTGDLGRLRPDGCLEHLGRKDHRVKIRGQSVEPAEVEGVLVSLPGVAEAAVAAVESPAREAVLVAYVVPSQSPPPPPARLRRDLAQRLPPALVPSLYVTLDRLPLDANGKVDRRALPAPPASRPGTPYAPPRDALEKRIARIWKRELSVPGVGARDDFFELGGDSLSAARAAARIEKTLGRPVPPGLLFAEPTVALLAAALCRGEAWRRGSDPLVELEGSGGSAPILLVPAREGELLLSSEIARRLGPDRPSYAFRWTHSRGGGIPSSVEEMASEAIACLRRVQPRGPYRLAGFCFGAVVALEIARQVRLAGDEVALLVLIGISPFDFPELASPAAREREERLREGPSIVERFGRHARDLRTGSDTGGIALLARKGILFARFAGARARAGLRSAERRGRNAAWLAACRAFGIFGRPIPARLRDPDRIRFRVFPRYRARPDPGRVDLFLAGKEREAYSEDPAADFAGLAKGGLTVFEAPCGGIELLIEPHVAALAERLRALLLESEKTRTAGAG